MASSRSRHVCRAAPTCAGIAPASVSRSYRLPEIAHRAAPRTTAAEDRADSATVPSSTIVVDRGNKVPRIVARTRSPGSRMKRSRSAGVAGCG